MHETRFVHINSGHYHDSCYHPPEITTMTCATTTTCMTAVTLSCEVNFVNDMLICVIPMCNNKELSSVKNDIIDIVDPLIYA